MTYKLFYELGCSHLWLNSGTNWEQCMLCGKWRILNSVNIITYSGV